MVAVAVFRGQLTDLGSHTMAHLDDPQRLLASVVARAAGAPEPEDRRAETEARIEARKEAAPEES